MILCNDPRQARSRARRVRPTTAAKGAALDKKSRKFRDLVDTADPASQSSPPRSCRGFESSIWRPLSPGRHFVLRPRRFLKRARSRGNKSARLAVLASRALAHVSLPLITGMAGDLASLGCRLPSVASKPSLNLAWLRFASVRPYFGARSPDGRGIGRREQDSRVG